ncbi:hypothetical protein [Novosphingobium sp. KA1]|uniref:hypothetical protein n=1 Tax=Novosphingobium sp. (strain KA1) TaxID=164608 RepID=UPI001A8F48DF|nr:hypothetical protein [Novosphingobium sp. KA1]QSR19598.1 hypothetical protein CA833_20810 [Novosphingobium sp. KA1]
MIESSTDILAQRLLEARVLEHRRRVSLLKTARSGTLDLPCSHVLVCHAENGSLRAAKLDSCLRHLADSKPSGGDHPSIKKTSFRKSHVYGPASLPKTIKNSLRAKAIYRLLVRLAKSAGEPVIGAICAEFISQEQALLDMLTSTPSAEQ